MTAPRQLLTTVFAIVCLGTFCQAKGDTLIFGGTEIRFPDVGWYVVFARGKASIINEKNENLIVEVYRLRKVPATDKEAIAKVMKFRSGVTAVEVLTVMKLTQHGASAIVAKGTAKTATAPVDVRLTGIPVGDRALVAVAYFPQKDEKNLQTMENILKSIKTRGKPSDAKKPKPDAIAGKPKSDPAKVREKPADSQPAKPESIASTPSDDSAGELSRARRLLARLSRITSRVMRAVRRARLRAR